MSPYLMSKKKGKQKARTGLDGAIPVA